MILIDALKKIKGYNALENRINYLQEECQKLKKSKDHQDLVLKNYRLDNEFLSNLLVKKESALQLAENRRKKCASKIGGMQTRINSLLAQNETFKQIIEKNQQDLSKEKENVLSANEMIVSLNKEIKRLKTKPATTMENLMKYEITRKSPRKR